MSQFDDLLESVSGGKGSANGGGIGDILGGGKGGAGLAAMLPMLAPVVAKMLAGGGLQKVLAGFQEKGMGDKADSWVGKGENRAIDADELRQAVGDDAIRDAASHAGVSEGEAASGLAALLPQVVDRVTPNGELPDDAEVDRAAQQLANIGLTPG